MAAIKVNALPLQKNLFAHDLVKSPFQWKLTVDYCYF